MSVSQKGLLPQLVDVLHALTESQELLTYRIRRAHEELLTSQNRGVDGLGQAFRFEVAQPHGPLLGPTMQLHAPELLAASSSNGSEQRINPSGFSQTPIEAKAGMEPRGLDLVQPEETTPPRTLEDAESSVAGHQATEPAPQLRQPEDVERSSGDITDAQSGTRSYNFFDELDARLADLRNSENGSDAADA